MTTHFTATDTASFDGDIQDIDGGPDSAANTAYTIGLANGISVDSLTLALKQGASLEIDGPGFLVVNSGETLTVTGSLTLDAPVTGDLLLDGSALTIDAVTQTGGIQGGGALRGSVTGETDGDGLTNYGTIDTSGSVGVHLTGGAIANEAGGSIMGVDYGVAFDDAGSLSDAGSITGGGVGASFAAAGTVTLSASGVIQGSGNGLDIAGAAAVSNLGMIEATTSDAISAASGTVVNGSATVTGATIQTQGFNAVEIDGAGTVANDGQIVSGDIAGVYLGSGEVDNGLDATGATIQGAEFGVLVASGSGTVRNDGAILLSGTPSQAGSQIGVVLEDGGSVANGAAAATVTAAARISGVDYGIAILGAAGAVANTGSITGDLAVDLEDGGTVVNGPAQGVGSITGTSYGVRVIGAGTTAAVVNAGSISGQVGVDFFDANGSATGTLTDSGAIASTAGATGTAIRFGSGAERLVLQSGYAITGIVQGGAGATDVTTLELAAGTTGAFSGVSGGTGAVTGKFSFQAIAALDIDTGASWSFAGTESVATLQVGGTATIGGTLAVATLADDAGTLQLAANATLELGAATGHGNTLALSAGSTLKLDHAATFGTGQGSAAYTGDVIAGFVGGTAIDLADIASATAVLQSYDATTHVAQISDGTHTADLAFAAGTPASFVLHSDGQGGTLLEAVACYCAGTLIATPAGEVAVEHLAIGDSVLTADGRTEPVRWIGRRSYAGRMLVGRRHLLPVRIAAGALGGGLPRRDLFVSPSHAMLLDGMLVPAQALLDGRGITQATGLERVDYLHIELARHDAILAEGAASETFMDDDSRMMFQNAHDHARLYPDHAPAPPPGWCARRVTSGYALERLRRRLAGVAWDERAA